MLKRISSLFPLIGIILFLYIVHDVGLDNILAAFSRLNLLLVFVLVPTFIVLISFLRGVKWKSIIALLSVEYSLRRSIQVLLIGFFAGFVTPGRVGDMIRSVYLKNDSKLKLTDSFSTVFVDRLTDLAVLLIWGAGSAFVFSYSLSTDAFYGLIAVSLLLIILLYMLTKRKMLRFALRPFYNLLVPLKFKKNVSKHFNAFFDALDTLRKSKRRLVAICCLTVLNWVVIFMYMCAIARMLNLEVTFFYIMLISPLIPLIETLPISIGGLGTREAALITLFSLIEIDKGSAVAFSLVYMVLSGWSFALLGFVFWLKNPMKLRT